MIKKSIIVGIILLFIGICIIPGIAQKIEKSYEQSSENNWLYVGGTGPGNYSTIQDAIDNSSDGDTVFVYSGTYIESLMINKTIHLLGEEKNNTILLRNNSGEESLMTITANRTVISGFTCELARIYSIHGIEVTGYNNTISNNIIKNCSGGGGIVLKLSYNIISNNTLTKGQYSEGIVLYGATYNIIENNTIKNADYCGILLFRNADSNIIKNNFLLHCGVGIEFYAGNNDNIVSNNVISDNAYGLWFYTSDENYIFKNDIINNSEYGVYLFISLKYFVPSNWNRFYCNNFINNGLNAYDECLNIWWKFSLGHCIGNYWDDYIGLQYPRVVDFNNDGTGFLHKRIPGNDRFGADWFPLMEPYGIPGIS